jgi:hypothetical protein
MGAGLRVWARNNHRSNFPAAHPRLELRLYHHVRTHSNNEYTKKVLSNCRNANALVEHSHLVDAKQLTSPLHMLPRLFSINCRHLPFPVVFKGHVAEVKDGAQHALDGAHLCSVDSDRVHTLLGQT